MLDDINNITHGRRIARCFSKYGWYSPQVKNDDNGIISTLKKGEDTTIKKMLIIVEICCKLTIIN